MNNALIIKQFDESPDEGFVRIADNIFAKPDYIAYPYNIIDANLIHLELRGQEPLEIHPIPIGSNEDVSEIFSDNLLLVESWNKIPRMTSTVEFKLLGSEESPWQSAIPDPDTGNLYLLKILMRHGIPYLDSSITIDDLLETISFRTTESYAWFSSDTAGLQILSDKYDLLLRLSKNSYRELNFDFAAYSPDIVSDEYKIFRQHYPFNQTMGGPDND
ncbi:hypothetical protein [Weissella confusa]|uniref:hypothetical protein n=1 Tax=Weissella confusa TaxID=1583 RepID=UPI001080846E|nr:hypothetical protein [Weissella confusa]TGE71047.1 hypothetical protein C6P15_01925 [Weissella confusa]